MALSMSSGLRGLLLTLAWASCWPAAALAQASPAPAAATSDGDTIRLSDAERDAILNSNTEASAAAARGELTGPHSPGPGIHGELGVMVGSNGTRGVYGAADIPLGDNAGATITFENSRYGYRRPAYIPR